MTLTYDALGAHVECNLDFIFPEPPRRAVCTRSGVVLVLRGCAEDRERGCRHCRQECSERLAPRCITTISTWPRLPSDLTALENSGMERGLPAAGRGSGRGMERVWQRCGGGRENCLIRRGVCSASLARVGWQVKEMHFLSQHSHRHRVKTRIFNPSLLILECAKCVLYLFLMSCER